MSAVFGELFGCSVAGYRSSRLYRDDHDGVLDILQKQSVVFHNHHWCVTEQVTTVSSLDPIHTRDQYKKLGRMTIIHYTLPSVHFCFLTNSAV